MADQEISKMEEEKTAWERLLRRLLPAGAPLPDEEHLDYSISIDYIGPPIPSMSQTKRGNLSSSIATDPWRESSSTAVARKGTSMITSVRGDNLMTERKHDPRSEIEKFPQPMDSPIGDLGLRCEDRDNSLDSDSNSMFSLKSFTIAGDLFDLQIDNLNAGAVVGDVISNLDSDSKFSLRSLFAINKHSDLCNKDIENPRDLGKRGTTDMAVKTAAAIARKGTRKESGCSKCRKGPRLNFRETCILFGARYCRSCMCA